MGGREFPEGMGGLPRLKTKGDGASLSVLSSPARCAALLGLALQREFNRAVEEDARGRLQGVDGRERAHELQSGPITTRTPLG